MVPGVPLAIPGQPSRPRRSNPAGPFHLKVRRRVSKRGDYLPPLRCSASSISAIHFSAIASQTSLSVSLVDRSAS